MERRLMTSASTPYFCLSSVGGSRGLADTAGEGDDGQVLAGALNLGLAEGQDEVVLLGSLAHGEGLAVHKPEVC